MGYVLEISDMAGYGGSFGPENWTAVGGLLEFEVTRSGPARVGTFEGVYASTSVPQCGKAAFARQRFRLRDNTVTTVQNLDIIMVGRLDDVEPVEDSRYGRVIKVKGRDYLGALVDNHVDSGFDRWSYMLTCDPAHLTDPWVANWVGFDTGQGYGLGQSRTYMIAQLAMNILEQGLGIMAVVYPYGPIGSKPVEMNYEGATGYTILDAIRNMAREDPWGTGWPWSPSPISTKRDPGRRPPDASQRFHTPSTASKGTLSSRRPMRITTGTSGGSRSASTEAISSKKRR